MKNIDNTNIRKIQKENLTIMKYFIDFCKVNNLRYFIAGGTLLGAVRHHGFIPWDDDMDIAMPRKDYQRLLELQDKIENPYNLRNWKFDSKVNYLFSKLENVNTTKIEQDNGETYIGGIAIDIFPQDGMPDDELKREKFLKKFTFLKVLRDYEKNREIKSLKQLFYKMISAGFKYIKRINCYEEVLEQVCMTYDYDKCEYARSFYGVYGKRETYIKALYGEGCMILFENMEVLAPVHWDDYLKQMYGDYMKLPPLDKQCTTHNMASFSLNHSYREIVE